MININFQARNYNRMIKDTRSIFLLCLIIFLFSACGTEKNLVYFQKSNKASDTVSVYKAYVPKIQSGDILSIYINSLSPEASSFFNPYSSGSASGSEAGASSGGGGANQQTSGSSYLGNLVNPAGEIEMPLLGSIKVSGYTTTQLRDTLKILLKTYLERSYSIG